MNQFEYKTLVPALVGSGILLFTAVSGHAVSAATQNIIVNDIIAVISFGLSVWGTLKNHRKVG